MLSKAPVAARRRGPCVLAAGAFRFLSDVPEALTSGGDHAEALAMAEDALVAIGCVHAEATRYSKGGFLMQYASSRLSELSRSA